MNSMIKSSGSMHEMLFEKRNKDYGAYVLRSAYNDTVVKSLIMVASTLLLFIGGIYAYNNFFAERVAVEEAGLDSQQQVVTVVNLNPLETPKPEPAGRPQSTPATAAIATVIKDDAKIDPDKKDLPVSVIATPAIVGDTTGKEPIGDPTGNGGIAAVIKVEKPEQPVLIADEMPEYPGGPKAMMDFFSKNVVYPERSKIMGNEGTVFVNFVVGANGKITSWKVLKGVDDDCNEEALRVVSKMPVWKPGKNAGKEVPVMFNLPIKFKLN